MRVLALPGSRKPTGGAAGAAAKRLCDTVARQVASDHAGKSRVRRYRCEGCGHMVAATLHWFNRLELANAILDSDVREPVQAP